MTQVHQVTNLVWHLHKRNHSSDDTGPSSYQSRVTPSSEKPLIITWHKSTKLPTWCDTFIRETTHYHMTQVHQVTNLVWHLHQRNHSLSDDTGPSSYQPGVTPSSEKPLIIRWHRSIKLPTWCDTFIRETTHYHMTQVHQVTNLVRHLHKRNHSLSHDTGPSSYQPGATPS